MNDSRTSRQPAECPSPESDTNQEQQPELSDDAVGLNAKVPSTNDGNNNSSNNNNTGDGDADNDDGASGVADEITLPRDEEVFAAVNGMIDDDDDAEVNAFGVDEVDHCPLPSVHRLVQSPLLSVSPALNHIDSCSSSSSQPCSGVRRKSYTVTTPPAARFPSSPSEGYSPSIGGGAKRKIRPSSDSHDYFAIWTAHSPSPSSAHELHDVSAFLSAATPKHRPLERSWPPRVQAYSQQRSSAAEPFNFELIDTDEPNAFIDAPHDDDEDHVDFIPGEFFEMRRHAGDGQVHAVSHHHTNNNGMDENAPLATPETDGSLSDGLPLRLGATPKHYPEQPTASKLKPLLKKKIGPDNYISTILTTNMVPTNYNYPIDESSSSLGLSAFTDRDMAEGSSVMANGAEYRCQLKGEFIPLKPHKPLTRQMSNGASPKYSSFERPGEGGDGSPMDQNRHFVLCRKPSPLSPRPRSPPSGSSTRSASPLDQQQSE